MAERSELSRFPAPGLNFEVLCLPSRSPTHTASGEPTGLARENHARVKSQGARSPFTPCFRISQSAQGQARLSEASATPRGAVPACRERQLSGCPFAVLDSTVFLLREWQRRLFFFLLGIKDAKKSWAATRATG